MINSLKIVEMIKFSEILQNTFDSVTYSIYPVAGRD